MQGEAKRCGAVQAKHGVSNGSGVGKGRSEQWERSVARGRREQGK